MGLETVSVGHDAPHDCNVIIEISQGQVPVKYEMDKDSGSLFVDRFMSTAMFYPANYGFIPHTLSEDGDPVDVLVIAPHPLMAGSVIRARPVGMLKMTDESGVDAKILAVPVSKLTKLYDHVEGYEDICAQLRASIEHFFSHYKDLEQGKWVKIDGWDGIDAAKQEILASIERFHG